MLGNEAETGVVITRIDTLAITGSVSYSPSGFTSGDVVVKLTLNKLGKITEDLPEDFRR
jgi:hypothetical protein